MKAIAIVAWFLSTIGNCEVPDCKGKEQWPVKMSFVQLKNAGISANNRIDFSKTKVIRLASEKLNNGIYRQVHQITFFEKNGSEISVISINVAMVDGRAIFSLSLSV